MQMMQTVEPQNQHQERDQTKKKMPFKESAKQVFMNRRFYLHFKCKANFNQASEVIKTFGGQIEEFLDGEVSYLLTDHPRNDWPPEGADPTLQIGVKFGIKLMSFNHLIIWCKHYITSQSSSDEDEESKVHATELRGPFIKYEDYYCRYAPTVKELPEWPKVNLKYPLIPGQSIFGFPHPSISTTQPSTPRPTNCTNTRQSSVHVPSNAGQFQQIPQHQHQRPENDTLPLNPCRRVFRRNLIHCELCNQRVAEKQLDEHIESPMHKSNIENAKWGEVESVIDSLPDMGSLINSPKRVQLTNLEDHQEFLCLNKMESISQLFLNSSK